MVGILHLKGLNLGVVLIATVLGCVARFHQDNVAYHEYYLANISPEYAQNEFENCTEWVSSLNGNPEICPYYAHNVPQMENAFVGCIILALLILIVEILLPKETPRSDIKNMMCLLVAGGLLVVGGGLIISVAVRLGLDLGREFNEFVLRQEVDDDTGLPKYSEEEVQESLDEDDARDRVNTNYDIKITSGVLCLAGSLLSLILGLRTIVAITKPGEDPGELPYVLWQSDSKLAKNTTGSVSIIGGTAKLGSQIC